MKRTNLLLGAAVAVVAAVAAASGASAQAVAVPPAPTGRETELDLTSYLYYDSNSARSDAQLAAQRGLALSEGIFEPSGTLTVARQAGRFLVYAIADGGYDFHTYNTVRDRERVDVSGGATGRFARCQETLNGGYDSSQTDLGDVTLGVINNDRQTENVGLMVACGRSVGLAPSLSVGETWTNNSALIERIVDSRTFHLNAGIGYQRPGLGVASLFGGYSEISYPNRGLPGGGNGFSYDLYEGGVRFERHVGARIDTSLSVSYSELDPSVAGASGFHGLTYALDGTYHLTSRITLHASGTRATLPSSRVNANFEITEAYDADIDYKFGSRLDFKLEGDWKHDNFVGAGAQIPGILDLTVETTYDVVADVTFTLTQRLSFILSVSETRRDANFAPLSYDSTTVGLTAKAKF
jgi:hypothetical protein